MAHRPYPNPDRALRQLHRHDPRRSEALTPPAWRELSEGLARLRRNTRRALAAQRQWTGEYRMSTR
jgi:hypothetical protein